MMNKVSLIFLLLPFIPGGSSQQKNRMEKNREDVIKFREKNGDNRDLAIFVRNYSPNITTSNTYLSWGHYRELQNTCSSVGTGDEYEGICYLGKRAHTATGVSGLINFSLGDFTGSWVAIIFSVPFNRISSCNWFGVHLVNTPQANEKLYDELYGKTENEYTPHTGTLWKNVTDGFYSVTVTMTHSTISDMEIIISGKGRSSNPPIDPATAALIRVINGFVHFAAGTVISVGQDLKESIAIQVNVFNHNMAGYLSHDSYIEHGKVPFSQSYAKPNGTATWIFEKVNNGWYGARAVLTLSADEWNTPRYHGATVWLYIDISYSNMRSNYYGFGITQPMALGEVGEAETEKFYDEETDNKHVIYVPSTPKNFAMAFDGYIIEGQFSAEKRNILAISVMKVDQVKEPMMERLRMGKLHHLSLCSVSKDSCVSNCFACERYHGEAEKVLSSMKSKEVAITRYPKS